MHLASWGSHNIELHCIATTIYSLLRLSNFSSIIPMPGSTYSSESTITAAVQSPESPHCKSPTVSVSNWSATVLGDSLSEKSYSANSTPVPTKSKFASAKDRFFSEIASCKARFARPEVPEGSFRVPTGRTSAALRPQFSSSFTGSLCRPHVSPSISVSL